MANDLIDRQAAIDALTHKWDGMVTSVFDVINSLPSAQSDHSGDVNGKVDLIDRQAVIDLLKQMRKDGDMVPWEGKDVFARIRKLPSAQPDLDEWCTDCKEYDKERNSCPRWNRVIKETLKDLQKERKMQLSEENTTFDCISRQAAIDALDGNVIVTSRESAQAVMDYIRECADRIRSLPSAQPDLDSAYTEGYTQAEAKYRAMWDEMQANIKAKAFGKRKGLIHTADIDAMPTIKPERPSGREVYQAGYADGYKAGRAERKRMSNKEWVDFLSEQFTVSRTSAREMLHGLMRWKAEDNFKKQFSGGRNEKE